MLRISFEPEKFIIEALTQTNTPTLAQTPTNLQLHMQPPHTSPNLPAGGNINARGMLGERVGVRG